MQMRSELLLFVVKKVGVAFAGAGCWTSQLAGPLARRHIRRSGVAAIRPWRNAKRVLEEHVLKSEDRLYLRPRAIYQIPQPARCKRLLKIKKEKKVSHFTPANVSWGRRTNTFFFFGVCFVFLTTASDTASSAGLFYLWHSFLPRYRFGNRERFVKFLGLPALAPAFALTSTVYCGFRVLPCAMRNRTTHSQPSVWKGKPTLSNARDRVLKAWRQPSGCLFNFTLICYIFFPFQPCGLLKRGTHSGPLGNGRNPECITNDKKKKEEAVLFVQFLWQTLEIATILANRLRSRFWCCFCVRNTEAVKRPLFGVWCELSGFWCICLRPRELALMPPNYCFMALPML